LLAVGMFGFNYGIEFTGGSILEIEYPAGRPDVEELRTELAGLEWHGTQVQATGEKGYIVRTKPISDDERKVLISTVSGGDPSLIEIKRFDSIGPTIGAELREKAWWAVGLVMLAIVLYVAFAFRGVSHPVSSWVYGFVAIVALLHDVVIPAGVYVVLGHYFIDAQIDALFITAILTVLGFSVHDTIVVFDRTRENLKNRTWKEFRTTVGKSVEQTFARSINTSLTVLIVTFVLYFVGGETTKNFALVLGVGILVGTYSSIFLGSPLLVAIEEWQRKKETRR
ncbi:MAG TPA: protein translocase subunit SecF, partial [Candidatus Paceibacterota bacterium]|nr:protein translocase subunit SecF [Candidatus Paceibacterota bacterium]